MLRFKNSRFYGNPNINFGYSQMEKLLSIDPNKALTEFLTNLKAIEKYFARKCILLDQIVLVFEVITYVATSENKLNLTSAFSSDLTNVIFLHAKYIISELHIETNNSGLQSRRFWNAPEKFIENIISVVNLMLDLQPKKNSIGLEIINVINFYLKQMTEQYNLQLPEDVEQKLSDLKLKISSLNIIWTKSIYKDVNSQKYLEWLQRQNLEDILLDFEDVKLSVIKNEDDIILLMDIVAEIVKALYPESIKDVLDKIINANYFRKLKYSMLCLTLVTTKNTDHFVFHHADKFYNFLKLIFNALIEKIPPYAKNILMEIHAIATFVLDNVTEDVVIKFISRVHHLCTMLMIKVEQLDDKGKMLTRSSRPLALGPRTNFRDIDVYPSALEITTHTHAYLRKNIVKGAYEDVYHYLDVQFRLLREDFVAPLRKGICEYLDMMQEGKSGRLSNIKLHKNTRYLETWLTDNQLGFKMQIFQPHGGKNYKNLKQFMFGSLVCLTADNFTTMIFGTIICRNEDLLKKGQLVIGCDVGVKLETNKSYIFVECLVYFEPYYQVLTALKLIDDERLPFKEYLVDVQAKSELPAYVTSENDIDLELEKGSFNESQYKAYCSAIQNKFCIVQGPPGTGKTYLALKVSHTLLDYKRLWNTGPMLIVCVTNHALDQFLEGLLPKTTNLVRIGGQSKSASLEKYNLQKLRCNMQSKFYACRDETCLYDMHRYKNSLRKINEYACIFKFSSFNNISVDKNYGGSWFSFRSDREMLRWLLFKPNRKNHFMDINFDVIKNMLDNKTTTAPKKNKQDINSDDPILRLQLQNQLVFDTPRRLLDTESTEDVFDLYEISQIINDLAKHIVKLEQTDERKTSDGYLTAISQMKSLKYLYSYVSEKLNNLKCNQRIVPVNVNYRNPTQMTPDDQWALYGNWVVQYKQYLMQQYDNADENYRKNYKKNTEIKDLMNLRLLRSVDVIGMTTTGAARMHNNLQVLKCPIIIIEEAAEVLEAHIITALSPGCQHLILIGDHKQLKPSTADYILNKRYDLGVSLFERMVENGVHCSTLDVQHRMRPDISNLICPAIYPVLHNHESVMRYPEIRGVSKSLYFITHDHFEHVTSDCSKNNQFEAEYLVELARYLVLNNYEPAKITILVTYSAQFYTLRKLKEKYDILEDIRVCILDNFQGEENDIILLSLVRNNMEGDIGFLRTENRVCVALSRARHGMYIMGNIELLSSKSQLWQEVFSTLKANDADCVIELREISDFQKAPNGGCLKKCAYVLQCGHICQQFCHSTSHDNYSCTFPCERTLCELNHVCPAICSQKCGECIVPKSCTLPCGHTQTIYCYQSSENVKCTVKVPTNLPCRHNARKPCFLDVDKLRCPYPCEARVEPCGHACTMKCHMLKDPNHESYYCPQQCIKENLSCSMPTDKKHKCMKQCGDTCGICKVLVRKQRSCKHFHTIPCAADVERVVCKQPCEKSLLPHISSNICTNSNDLCQTKIPKTISECGHRIQLECYKEPIRPNCTKPCVSMLACGHICPLLCKEECSKAQCIVLRPTTFKYKCGHKINIPCCMHPISNISETMYKYCTAECAVVLKCGHKCSGICGKCLQTCSHNACTQPQCNRLKVFRGGFSPRYMRGYRVPDGRRHQAVGMGARAAPMKTNNKDCFAKWRRSEKL